MMHQIGWIGLAGSILEHMRKSEGSFGIGFGGNIMMPNACTSQILQIFKVSLVAAIGFGVTLGMYQLPLLQ